MRSFVSVSAVLLFIASIGPASAQPPPPPPPLTPAQQAAEHASDLKACAGDLTVKPISLSPVRIQPLSGAEIGVKDGRVGKLIYRWGVRIASDDPRVGGVTGMDLTAADGFVATTVNGDWLTFDIQNGTLRDIKGVGVASIRDAPGEPASFADVYGRPIVAFPAQREVATFRFRVCGFRARAEPLLTVGVGPGPSIAAPAAYSYTAVVGDDGHGLFDGMRNLPWGSAATIDLVHQDFIPPPGYRLQALTDPSKIVPFFIALWRSESGDRTLVQQLYVPAFADVVGPNGPPPAPSVAEFPVAMEAVASALDRSSNDATLFFVRHDRTPGRVDIYAFDFPGAD